jgi:hypothetical protein
MTPSAIILCLFFNAVVFFTAGILWRYNTTLSKVGTPDNLNKNRAYRVVSSIELFGGEHFLINLQDVVTEKYHCVQTISGFKHYVKKVEIVKLERRPNDNEWELVPVSFKPYS